MPIEAFGNIRASEVYADKMGGRIGKSEIKLPRKIDQSKALFLAEQMKKLGDKYGI